MSIKSGQGVFQPDVHLQDDVSFFLRSLRLSDLSENLSAPLLTTLQPD